MALSTSIPRLFVSGALCAMALATGAPAAVADDTIVCEPGQIVIDGQCHVPAGMNNNAGTTGGTTGSTTGGHGNPGSHSH
ncbi:hypothetical protein [Mycolicibacterium sp. CBMA 226]|uniref:hypothetical protein n=1 Tax=Mycolicibacterium sp. CBMA 226 TaxID=2606611 RepID=UPI0012DBF516|nr:hypothetical protein [Mycolicibacterium sp. CBMA 226]MUL79212.1 hypothetical protein [Mycolicibacterium sp. CBMA 226]